MPSAHDIKICKPQMVRLVLFSSQMLYTNSFLMRALMKSKTTSHAMIFALSLSLSGLVVSPVLAHSENEDKKDIDYSQVEEHEFGKAADPDQAARTIDIEMNDQMQFTPAVVKVKRGEVVRFAVHNRGMMMHEMVLGTTEDLRHHLTMMKKSPGMKHSEPHMAHVSPGKSGQMGWQFTNSGEYYYGCLIPGHFEAGMKGKVIVR